MDNTSAQLAQVNTNKQIYTLHFTREQGPYVINQTGRIVRLPNSFFGRWFARVHFDSMQATPAGAEWYRQEDPLKIPKINGLLNAPRGHYQALAINRILHSDCGEWLDMGLGKTYIAIAFCLNIFQRTQNALYFVVCTPSLFSTWEDELALHVNKTLNAKTVLIHGAKRNASINALRENPPTSPTFAVTTYETLVSIVDRLQGLPISVIIADEIQKIKNLERRRTKALYRFKELHPHARRVGLSGTPSTRYVAGYYSIFEWLGEGYSGKKTHIEFKSHYVNSLLCMRCMLPSGEEVNVAAEPEENRTNWLRTHSPLNSAHSYLELGYRFDRAPRNANDKVIRILHYFPIEIGLKNETELHMLHQTHAYTVYKKDVLHDLPPKIYSRRELRLHETQRKAYEEIATKKRTVLDGRIFDFTNLPSVFTKLHQIANGFLLPADENQSPYLFKHNPKLDMLEDLLDELGDQKIVIWSAFRAQIAQTTAWLKAKKISVCELHGDVTPMQRQIVVRQFQSPNGPTCLVSNQDVGGEGLNLQIANTECFLSNGLKPDKRLQAEDRLHRIGQNMAVSVIDCPMKGTVEVRILNNLRKYAETEVSILKPNDLMGDLR